MIKYLRKLDLLNRIFVLKYADLSVLEQPSVLRLPQVQGEIYSHLTANEITDKELLLLLLTRKRLYYLASMILIGMAKVTKGVCLDSKILRKLRNYYSQQVFNDTIRSEVTEFVLREWLVELLQSTPIDDILGAMVAALDLQLRDKSYYRKREFNQSQVINQDIVEHFCSENLVDKFVNTLSELFPCFHY